MMMTKIMPIHIILCVLIMVLLFIQGGTTPTFYQLNGNMYTKTKGVKNKVPQSLPYFFIPFCLSTILLWITSSIMDIS